MAEKPLSLSARQARRIAVHAQGLSKPRRHPAPAARHLRRLADDLGVIQIDSVNVLTRTHYLPAFSRLGAYPREALEREAWGRKPSLFEYWGHECSLLPVASQPLFRWRMDRARAGDGTWPGLAHFARERRDYVNEVLKRIEREGPLAGGDFADGPQKAGWWNWSHGKRALEWLFWSGAITTKTRRNFERVYDLTERVLPAKIMNLPTPDEADAHRTLLIMAARAMGVATEGDLRDYFRMPVAETKARLAELVEEGALTTVAIQGWRQPAFLAPDTRAARPDGAALLSPFDNLIWRRERAERLFGTRIRLEIYTPAHKREHGYYVLPFLQGETITARTDLKADRAASVLRVQAAHLERGSKADLVAGPLAAELQLMAAWLGLGGVTVVQRGDLAGALGDHLESALA